MSINEIFVQGARAHNLKNITIAIPKNTLTVITGPSGSGKSSLAFDTIYVEGQRRYIESLSSYARQFLGQYQPPEVDSISGLSPSIAIDQKTTSKNPRSTVGTTTEIFDYLRVLYARIGTLYSPSTEQEIKKWTPHQVAKDILKNQDGTKIQILAPLNNITKKSYKNEISRLLALGLNRCRADGEYLLLSDIKEYSFDRFEIVIDRIIIKEGSQKRIIDSIEYAFKMGDGIIIVNFQDKIDSYYCEQYIDPISKEAFPELEPRLFSFNSPIGACKRCNGIGEVKRFDISLLISDPKKSINDGAIIPLQKKSSFLTKMVQSVAHAEKIDLDIPFNKLPKKFITILFEGSSREYTYSFTSENSHFEFKKPFPGIPQWLEKKLLETQSQKVKEDLECLMNIQVCPDCKGLRLNPYALSTKISGHNIMSISAMPLKDMLQFFKELKLEGEKKEISEKLIKEITNRTQFLINVGLDYLTLNRAANTLSGGEAQRIRLATQIGSALTGVLYVLDEPSIGLHQKDNQKLIKTLKSLRDLGNTVLVVEHDEETIVEADFIIDMGPGAGTHGGQIVASGPIKDILSKKSSLTADYITKKKFIPIPKERLKPNKYLTISGVNKNNLVNLDVKIPLGLLCCITGVSGSGKSTLIHQVLVPAIKDHINEKTTDFTIKHYSKIEGTQEIQSIIELDQSPIGRTPHSNPATYTGIFDEIRTIFSQTQESNIRGYKPGRFSFNVKGGRCEDCEGNGVKKIEMHFLPDVFITCSDCKGTRYNKETLNITYKGKNIAEILEMTIEEAYLFFKNHPKISRVLNTLCSVGLGYMKLGQAATTLSGGEAQRLKLSRELSKRAKGHCLYVLDEPTTGLHFEDIKILLNAIGMLRELGHSIIIIEHNLDVIKTSDYIIDLGPDGGRDGGQIVCEGTPEEVAKNKTSHTSKYLKRALSK